MIPSLTRRVTPWMRRCVGFSTFDHFRELRWPLSADPLTDAENGPVVFVEPHYDDAVFSCGGTISALRAADREVHLVSVFTGAPSRVPSALAQAIHATWPEDGPTAYARRRREAEEVARAMDVEAHALGIPEVIYRNVPLGAIDDIFDPTVPVETDPAVDGVAGRLRDVLAQLRPAALVLPLGIGHHYDHRVVAAAARRLAPRRGEEPAMWWYEDFPYVANPVRADAHREQGPPREGFALVDVTRTFDDRVRWAAMYEQQFEVLFGTLEQLRSRMYEYAASVGSPDRPHERFWKC